MQKQKGFLLVDVILGVVLFSLVVSAIIGTLIFSQQSRFVASQRQRALDIAEEGLEAIRNIRDESYISVATGDNGLSTTSTRWDMSGTSDIVDGNFTRKVTVSQISNTKKNVVSTVTWDVTDGNQAEVNLFSRLTNWRRLTTASAPTLFGVLDLTIANSGANTADGISIAYRSPYIYLGRANSAGGSEFYVIDVSNPASPSITGQLALNGDPNDIAVSGNYAYIASTDNSSELQVIDISTPSSPTLATTFDLSNINNGNSNANGLSLAVQGTYLYFTRANAGREFTIFSIVLPLAPAIISSLDLSGDPNDIVVSGNYAYMASTDNTSEFQVVDVSVPALPSLVSSFNLNSGSENSNGVAISYYSLGSDNTILIGREGSIGGVEFYTINVNTPTSPVLIGTLDIGTNKTINAIDSATSTQVAYVVSAASGANDYRAVDLTDLVNPTLLATLNLNDVPFDVVYGLDVDKVFIASGEDTEELEVISP